MKSISGRALRIIATIVLFASLPAVAQKARCTQAQITRLEDESDQIRNWSALHSYYLGYKACGIDDADAEEGYSESVARILVDSWKELPSGAPLMKRDIGFRRFVLSGINITLLVSDLDAIRNNSHYRCPKGQGWICKDFIAAVDTSNQ